VQLQNWTKDNKQTVQPTKNLTTTTKYRMMSIMHTRQWCLSRLQAMFMYKHTMFAIKWS